MKQAAISWTGGKDSVLALLAALERYAVGVLVTFVPDPPKPFLAHPLPLMQAQTEALGLRHVQISIGESAAEDYERGIADLAAAGIDVLVTGDVDRIEGHDNWIVERSRGLVTVERPLWQLDRREILRRMLDRGLEVVCSLAQRAVFAPSIVGRRLDETLVEELLARAAEDSCFDACGENGEYHTSVLTAPGFVHRLRLRDAEVHASGPFDYLRFGSIEASPLPNAREP